MRSFTPTSERHRTPMFLKQLLWRVLVASVLGAALPSTAPAEASRSPGSLIPHNTVFEGLRAGRPAWASQAAADLSVEQQLGQLIVGGFDGSRAPRFVRSALQADRMAGVILFGGNVGSRSQLRGLTGSLRDASRGAALVSVDQEGGLVRRIPFARPRQSQPAQGSVARVRKVARGAATDLRGLGVNVNFAPVADVPAGSRADILPRAFTGSPAVVGQKVVAATQGYRQGRVAATVKHFPGLGAAPRNTDDAAVTIPRSARALSRVDLAPFRTAIAAGVGLVMVAHARYPALDRSHLASQSRRVLDVLLRQKLGYRGAVVTDALEARAVLARLPVQRAAERSLIAGSDLLLLTRPASYGPVFRRIRTRARASPTVRRRLRESAARVLVLKRSLGLRLPRPRP